MQEFDLMAFLMTSGILVAVGGLVVTAIKYGVAWFNVKRDELLEKMHDKKVADALRKASDLVTMAVIQTAQVEAKKFKEAIADGKLSDEEKAELFQIAKDRALTLITNDMASLIVEDIGDLDAWLDAQIENSVWYSKK
jgi:hypothetical protein